MLNVNFWRYGIFLLVLSLGPAMAVHAATGKQGVVMQVSANNPDLWKLALNNAKNIQEEIGKDRIDVEIVALGPGIEMLRKQSKAADGLEKAKADGIVLQACANTMKSRGMSTEDLAPGIKTVPSGAAEIIQKQRQGWAYFAP